MWHFASVARNPWEWFGETGIILAAAVAGFVDTHSAAISVASLVASGKMSAADAIFRFWQGSRPTRSARSSSPAPAVGVLLLLV